MTHPGIGVTTTAPLIAATGDIDRFPSAKKLVGLALEHSPAPPTCGTKPAR